MRYLLLALLAFLVFRYVKYLFRELSTTTAGAHHREENKAVKIKSDPSKKETKFTEGEYIDYEEMR